MGVIRSTGSYSSGYSTRYTSYTSSTSMSSVSAGQVVAGTSAVATCAALVTFLIWAGPLTIAAALVEAIGTLVGGIGAMPATSALGWAAAQGAVIGTLYGLARMVMSRQRKGGVRFVEFLTAVPVAAAVGVGMAFVGLFGIPGLIGGDGMPGDGPIVSTLAAMKFLPLAGGGPPPPVAIEDYAVLVLFVILLLVAAIVVGLVTGKITGAMIGQITLGAVQDALKDAAKEATATYLTTENKEKRMSAAAYAAQSGAVSGALSGAISTAIGLHLAAVYAAGGQADWTTLLVIDVVSGTITTFVIVVCKMLLAPETNARTATA